MLDLRQTKEFAQYLKSSGWIVEKVNGHYVYIRKIPLTPFCIIKVQRPEKIPFKKIDQLAKKHRAFVIYLEPDVSNSIRHTLYANGYRLSRSPFLPTKTIQIDLTQPEKKILAQMKKDGRYCLKKAEKERLQLVKAKDLKRFQQTWKVTWLKQKYIPSLKNLKKLKRAFGPRSAFLAAQYQKRIMAGTIILMADKRAYYYRAFTTKGGRKKLAQYLLVWEAIKLAKKRGCKIFDFEGIYDERFPIKTWKGFSHFKKSFGGKEIKYPGCFVKHKLSLYNLLTNEK